MGRNKKYEARPKRKCVILYNIREESKMGTIKDVLMNRDKMTSTEADQLIQEAKQDLSNRLFAGETPSNICEEWFGLEPDYIVQLMHL